ncbi:MAG: NfeD family protein [Candidatus Heimdallarchaeota archaeon]|nr:NfeD family protein [Candidatus Heimdallarchaeota archaeon]
MLVDYPQISFSGIILGIILLFLGSLLGLPDLYFLGFLIFAFGIFFIIIQWITTGGIVEILNWLPIILIITIVSTLSSDFVSRSASTQTLTWPLIGIIAIVIFIVMMFQGGDLNFIVPFTPVIIGIVLIGLVIGQILWIDPVRGLAYSLGVLGILIMILWLKLRKSQVKAPVTGELSTIIGANGITTTSISPQDEGRVKIGASIWKATSNLYIPEETEIRVIGVKKDRFTLEVKTKK